MKCLLSYRDPANGALVAFKNSEDWMMFLFLIIYSFLCRKVQPCYQVHVTWLCSDRNDHLKGHIQEEIYFLPRVQNMPDLHRNSVKERMCHRSSVIFKSGCSQVSRHIYRDIWEFTVYKRKWKTLRDTKYLWMGAASRMITQLSWKTTKLIV